MASLGLNEFKQSIFIKEHQNLFKACVFFPKHSKPVRYIPIQDGLYHHESQGLSRNKNCFFFIIGILILVRRHLYIGTAHRFLCATVSQCHHQCKYIYFDNKLSAQLFLYMYRLKIICSSALIPPNILRCCRINLISITTFRVQERSFCTHNELATKHQYTSLCSDYCRRE